MYFVYTNLNKDIFRKSYNFEGIVEVVAGESLVFNTDGTHDFSDEQLERLKACASGCYVSKDVLEELTGAAAKYPIPADDSRRLFVENKLQSKASSGTSAPFLARVDGTVIELATGQSSIIISRDYGVVAYAEWQNIPYIFGTPRDALAHYQNPENFIKNRFSKEINARLRKIKKRPL